jgi:hypothetical protein
MHLALIIALYDWCYWLPACRCYCAVTSIVVLSTRHHSLLDDSQVQRLLQLALATALVPTE